MSPSWRGTPSAEQEAARVALACMDLTSLGDADTALHAAALVLRSRGPAGAPAALCVWPRFVPQVSGSLGAVHESAAARPKVAAVANFPTGREPLKQVLAQVRGILANGGDEVDLVLDWRALVGGSASEISAATEVVAAVRKACGRACLKLIIESGELREPALIQRASRIGLNEGADFLKTSTGKTSTGATPQAARVMLEAIAAHPQGARVGFKASGGVRTVRDAMVYIELVREILGPDALVPSRFRIGASGLLDDVEAVRSASSTGDADAGTTPMLAVMGQPSHSGKTVSDYDASPLNGGFDGGTDGGGGGGE